MHVAGVRASFSIAYSLVYGYRTFRNSAFLIDGQGELEMQMRPIEKGDVLVAISFAPYSSECTDVISAARNGGRPRARDDQQQRIGSVEQRLLESGAYLPPTAKQRANKD